MVRRTLIERGIPSEKLTVVMNSPDERYFRRRTKPPLLENGELRVVSHGTLVERYGFDTAIRAIGLLRERFPRIRLTIMGEGEFGATLSDLVAELGLRDHVQLIGFRSLDEVGEVLSQAHIGIAANKIDHFTRFILPTKLLEYVMVGVPAVVTQAPAVTEYFDESCVKLVQSDQAEDLARGIAELAIDPVGAAAMAARAANRYLPVYGWEQQMKGRYVGLVDELAG
jgi:glycosyltransferase involved in cell wall biosynthesis